MIESVSINWMLLVSHFLWILGAAVLVVLVAVKRFTKNALWISGSLIVVGVLLTFFTLSAGQLVLVKLENVSAAEIEGGRLLLPSELKLDPGNGSHPVNNEKMQDNTKVLFWDGFARTPYFRFSAGDYRVGFNARGTKAKDVFAKIKVEFESPDAQGYLVSRKRLYIELTNKMKAYGLTFRVDSDTIGRVRISYYNDLHIEGTFKGRDVFIKDVGFKKL
jgi:hypothetical protein